MCGCVSDRVFLDRRPCIHHVCEREHTAHLHRNSKGTEESQGTREEKKESIPKVVLLEAVDPSSFPFRQPWCVVTTVVLVVVARCYHRVAAALASGGSGGDGGGGVGGGYIYIVVDDNGGPRGWRNWSSRWRSSSSVQRRCYHVHAADFRTGGRGPADSRRSSARVYQPVGGTHRWRRGSGQASRRELWISLFGQGQHHTSPRPSGWDWVSIFF